MWFICEFTSYWNTTLKCSKLLLDLLSVRHHIRTNWEACLRRGKTGWFYNFDSRYDLLVSASLITFTQYLECESLGTPWCAINTKMPKFDEIVFLCCVKEVPWYLHVISPFFSLSSSTVFNTAINQFHDKHRNKIDTNAVQKH